MKVKLVAIIQGFIFGIIVLTSKKFKALSTSFLITLIFVLSYNNLQYYLVNIDLITLEGIYKTIFFPMGILIPPLFYFYITTFLNPDKKINSKEKFMYVPFLLFFLISLVYKILILFKVEVGKYLVFFNAISFLHEALTFIFMLIVLAITIKEIIIFKTKAKSVNYEKVIPATSWLLWIVIILFINTMLYSVSVADFYSDENPEYIHAVWLINSLLIYLFGHIGIYKFSIYKERNKIRQFLILENQPTSLIENKNPYKSKLIRIIEEQKGYLDSSFSLETLSKDLGISKSHLSRIFKKEFNSNFTTYINSLRVSSAKSLLSNSDFLNYTLIAIGLEAGFNSKTTFNTTFKKTTGMTPSEYRKTHQNT